MRWTSSLKRVGRPPLWRRWLLAVATVGTWGCGSQAYQQRLEETVTYFEYRDRVNRELGRAWSEKGISLQPPRQFRLVPAPAVPAFADGDEEAAFIDSSEDPRQPHYLGVELPGLVAAWEARVDVETGDSQGLQTAYLYVLSNYDRYLQQQSDDGAPADPLLLITDAENQVSRAVGVFLQEERSRSGQEKNRRYGETVPGGLPDTKYHPQQQFTAVTFSPEVQPTDVPIEMQLYEWEGKKTQVAILMVYPAGISPREDLPNRLLFALETFQASDQLPSVAGSGSTAPGPASQRGPAF